jgi:hypothetical protein
MPPAGFYFRLGLCRTGLPSILSKLVIALRSLF